MKIGTAIPIAQGAMGAPVSDYLNLVRVQLYLTNPDTDTAAVALPDLTPMQPDHFAIVHPGTTQAAPSHFCQSGGDIKFGAAADKAYFLRATWRTPPVGVGGT